MNQALNMAAMGASSNSKTSSNKVADTKNCSERNLWLHVKILYICFLITSVGLVCAALFSLERISHLKKDFEREFAHLRVVEFDGEQILSEWQRKVYSKESAWTPTPNYAGPFSEDDMDNDSDKEVSLEDEELLRVKRNADGQKSRKKQRKHRARAAGDAEKPPMFLPGEQTTDILEGSGNSPDDWMWLTTYSRIPVIKTMLLGKGPS